jgi:iron complex transport system permease protein
MNKNILIFAVLLLGLGIAIFSALCFGSVSISPQKTASILVSHSGSQAENAIVHKVRLPRVIYAVLVGGMLALCGGMLQSVLRNPLVDPFITGISSGAALGASIAIILGVASLALPSMAGAIITMLIVYRMSFKAGKINVTYLLLAGVMTGSLFSSIIMLISTAYNRDLVKVVFWLMGDLSNSDESRLLYIVLLMAPVVILALLFSNDLNIISAGEDEAKTLGVNPEAIKTLYFIGAGVLTGLCVSISGVIGFVGLIIPHLVRFFTGPDNRLVLPASFIAGSLYLLAADTVSRTLFLPSEIPVGIVTGIIGAPVFLYMLVKREKL